MFRLCLACSLGSCCVAFLLLASPVPADEAPNPATIEELIRQLGREEATQRDEAAKRLETIGQAAIVPLRRAAAKLRDPDHRLRALVVARGIESRAYAQVRRLIKEGKQLNVAALSADGRYAVAGGL